MNTVVKPQAETTRPYAAQVIELSELHEDTAGQGAPLVNAVNPLNNVKTRLQVCVGDVVLTVGQLLAAKEHQVLRLNQPVEQPVDLLLEGAVVARGQLLAVDGHFAIRISELPVALKG
ncbi:flagellar motor switch protein FliN/FliY [Duganella sacchari]|uniref:Flagellar motor switch protein FliN n=1 Tax=Duganella sacchari TaxID=551987 RepID=A0A1M7PL92_9BURK|nr:FliM/FliN family flagellar motor switch protein [Duganella sacchari]SHN17895.1 flagellar motor switch protein FliN/FliY [Duganella sacchari]